MKSQIPLLAKEFMQNPVAILYGEKQEIIEQLVKLGPDAIPQMLDALRHEPYPKGQHPIDVSDAVRYLVQVVSLRYPECLLEMVKQEPENHYFLWLVSALGYVEKEYRCQAVETLVVVLNSKENSGNHWVVRDAALQSLIKIGGKRIVDPLINALKDRSTMVKFTAVNAMRNRRNLRDPRALEALQRIVNNKSIATNSPFLRETALEVIELINKESNNSSKRGSRPDGLS